MWVLMKRPDGSEEEVYLSDYPYLEEGDILDDGSVVIAVRYKNEEETDAISMGFFADENDEESL